MRNFAVFAALFFLTATVPSEAAVGEWTPLGPYRIDVQAPDSPEARQILTAEALAFLERLSRRFELQRHAGG